MNIEWLRELYQRTKSIATMYTGTFIVVMILNQFLFFGFCLNPICLIAAMPHVLLITVFVGSWINNTEGWGVNENKRDSLYSEDVQIKTDKDHIVHTKKNSSKKNGDSLVVKVTPNGDKASNHTPISDVVYFNDFNAAKEYAKKNTKLIIIRNPNGAGFITRKR